MPPTKKRRLGDRPTPDLVILFLSGIVGFVIVIFTLVLLVLAIVDPNHNPGTLAIRVAALVNTLTGAIVGYLAGRGASRNGNGNGQSH